MRLGLRALALVLFALGCDSPTHGVARATEWTHPHLARFAQFDRWARRAGSSDAVLQNRDALGEATFAPIRRDDAIAAAWVRVDGERAFTLSLPAKAELPAGANWVSLRDPALGALRAARLDDCVRLAPAAKAAKSATACVLISRTEPTPPNGATTVTVAFRDLR